jgi:hypothetical protein
VHNLFADWYRQVDLGASTDVLKARWACVEAAAKKLEAPSVMEMTRVCFNLPGPESSAGRQGAPIALVYKEADVSFPMKGNEQLLRVMFGVTLAHAIEERHSLATTAALAVASASCAGLRATPAVPELLEIAERYLQKDGSARRERYLEDAVALPKFPKSEFAAPAAIEIVDAPNPNQWSAVSENFQHIKVWISQATTALDALAVASVKTRAETLGAFKANAERAALEHRIKVLKEETDVLWWLFGEFSSSTKRSWGDGDAPSLCIALGRELAELMAFYEPMSNTSSFLAKAVSRTAQADGVLSARRLLDECPSDWRSEVVEEVRSPVRIAGGVTPLHFGLIVRADGGDKWDERLAKLISFAADGQLSPDRWALQACREALLLSLLGDTRG